MVEKFNFYDIYGYLLPGIAFCGLLWAPFGFLLHAWPTQEFISAIFALVLSYFVGHIVQSFAMTLFLSTVRDRAGRDRYPSDLILDEDSPPFTTETKRKIEELSQKHLGIVLGTDLENLFKILPAKRDELQKKRLELEQSNKNAAQVNAEIQEIEGKLREIAGPKITRNRTDAFFQARSALLRDKKASYWEQFEGLYAMMRGLAAALAAASAYFLGWAMGLWCKLYAIASFWPRDHRTTQVGLAVLLLLIALIVITILDQARKNPGKRKEEMSTQDNGSPGRHMRGTGLTYSLLCVSLGIALFSGFLVAVGITYPTAGIPAPSFVLVLASLAAAVGAVRSFGAYKIFAWSFAEHVWRDFSNLELKSSSEKT